MKESIMSIMQSMAGNSSSSSEGKPRKKNELMLQNKDFWQKLEGIYLRMAIEFNKGFPKTIMLRSLNKLSKLW